MRFEGLVKIIQDALQAYGNTLVDGIKDRLRQEDKLASGKLYESIKMNVKAGNRKVILQVFAEDYLMWVENGRKPGKQPPVRVILKWIKARGITPASLPVPKKSGLPKVQKQLAFMIANSIGKKGIAPTPIVEPLLNETYDDFKENLQVELAGELTKEIYKDLTNVFKGSEFIKLKNKLVPNANLN